MIRYKPNSLCGWFRKRFNNNWIILSLLNRLSKLTKKNVFLHQDNAPAHKSSIPMAKESSLKETFSVYFKMQRFLRVLLRNLKNFDATMIDYWSKFEKHTKLARTCSHNRFPRFKYFHMKLCWNNVKKIFFWLMWIDFLKEFWMKCKSSFLASYMNSQYFSLRLAYIICIQRGIVIGPNMLILMDNVSWPL